MNITLSPDQQVFVQGQIEAEHYSSVEDLISEALDFLASRQQKLAEIRQQIEQIRNGQVTAGEEVFDRL